MICSLIVYYAEHQSGRKLSAVCWASEIWHRVQGDSKFLVDGLFVFFSSVEALFLYGGLVRIQWECIRNDFIAVVWFLSSTLLWK